MTNVIQTYIYHWSITKWQMSYKHTYIIDLLSSDKCYTNIHISLIYYQVTNVMQTYIYHWSITKWQMSYKHTYIIDLLSSDKCHTNIHISLISSMILHWCHWRQTLPMISILMLICFAWNGLLNVSHISDFAFDMILLWEIHSHKANQRWSIFSNSVQSSERIKYNNLLCTSPCVYSLIWIQMILMKHVIVTQFCFKLQLNLLH